MFAGNIISNYYSVNNSNWNIDGNINNICNCKNDMIMNSNDNRSSYRNSNSSGNSNGMWPSPPSIPAVLWLEGLWIPFSALR